MGYLDIIKRGFAVANKNLWAILTQIISFFALAAIFVAGLVALILTAVGSLDGVKLQDFKPEDIATLIQSSVVVITALVLLFLMFMLVAWLVMSYVMAGNLGCIIDTAKGTSAGFTSSGFFSAARRSALSLFAMYVLMGFIFLGVMVGFVAVGGIGIWGLLLPLKDAGRQLIAFAVGVPFLVVLILAVIVTWLFLYAGYMLSAVILVGEDTGAFHAVGAAYGYMKRNFWDVLLFTLLAAALMFAANVASQVVTLPFNMTSKASPMLAVALLPLVLVGMLLQMYVTLVATASYAVYYLDRTAPPAPEPAPACAVATAGPLPEAPGMSGEPDEEELLEPEILDEEEDKPQ